MRGHVVKRFKDSYSIVISLGRDPATGKYRQHFESVKGTKKDAEKRLSELLTQLDRGIYVKPGKSTLADYLASWLKDYCWPNLAPRSAEGYEYIVHTHLIPSLGKIPLTELKPQHLQHLYTEKLLNGRADCKGGLSNRSVQYMHVTLHKALSNAVRMGMIARNVADAVERPKVPRREMQTMSESDIHIFLEYAKSTLYYALFYTALFTGMRRSELLGLRWQDTDLLLCQISVNRTLHQLSNGEIVIRPCKTEKSRRLIALSPSTALVLSEHRESQSKLRQAIGETLSDDDLVFSHYNGKPLLPNSVSHAWEKLANRTGLKGIRFHDARHTHASLLLKQNVHPKIVQERLGHASVQITLDLYSHVAPGLQQAAANRFDDIVLLKDIIKEKTTMSEL
jgi:integrase